MRLEIPSDLNSQTRQLIAAGVAEKVMRFLPAQRANAVGAKLEDCKLWARWAVEDEDLRDPRLQVAVRYPSNREGDANSFNGCAITVAAKGPWCLANGETLDSDQLALVERLAGPRP